MENSFDRHHKLKTVNPYFTAVWERKKPFEVRKNDRDFRSGDTAILQEYDPATDTYSGRWIFGIIPYVLSDAAYCKDGYVVFTFEEKTRSVSSWRFDKSDMG